MPTTFRVMDYAWIALVVQGMWVIGLSVFLVLERRSAQATLAWIFSLAALPFVGLVIYFFFGPRRLERPRMMRLAAHRAIEARFADERIHAPASLPSARLIESALGPRLGRVHDVSATVHITGEAKYAALLRCLEQAEHHIHLEYYIWEPDDVGKRFRKALCKKADAGVEVRVIVDDFGSSNAKKRFWDPLREAGGEVRRFNTFGWRPRMFNFRTHRKIAVIDAAVAFTGGMNISNLHTAEFSKQDAWRDTHVELTGSIVESIQLLFLADWEYLGAGPTQMKPYLLATGPLADSTPPTTLRAQMLASGPDNEVNLIHKVFFSAIASARTRVHLTTPYFVPDEPAFQALVTAALSGADVQILVPNKGDVPLVTAAARSYYPELLEAGVRIFEYGPPVLHAKTLVIDDALAQIGSANFDNRSFRLQFEIAVNFYGAEMIEQLDAIFADDVQRAVEVTGATIEGASVWRRFYHSSARLLSPNL